MVPAKDLERAKVWYQEKLDLDPVETAEDGSLYYEAADGSRFLLYQSQVRRLEPGHHGHLPGG